MKYLIRSTSLTLCLLISSPSFAGPEAFQIPDDLDQTIQAGLHELYNFNFDRSVAIFDSIDTQAPEHPMVAFGIASAHWWRVSALVLETDENESKAFLEAINHCIQVSEEKIKKGDPTGEAHLVLGGALGLLGRWEATNHNWMSAYFKGKKAYSYLVKALKINPELIDANMGKGIFDYYVATLPAMVRTLAFLGMGGDPKVGLAELQKASTDGTYATTPSKLFLCQIYAQLENKPDKALEILLDLRKGYPRSPFIHMLQIITLYNKADIPNLKLEAQTLFDKSSDGTYPADYMGQAYFAQGAAHFKVREWDLAVKEFSLAKKKGNEKDPWWTWSQLYLGYCYDALGKREEAKTQYNDVLKLLRRWGSQDNAKARLKKPFKGTDKELEKLEL